MKAAALAAILFVVGCSKSEGSPAPASSSSSPPVPVNVPVNVNASATASAPASAPAPAPASAPAPAPASADASTACGTKPLPDCPMQAWMKKNVSPAMAADNLAAIADALDKIATFSPPGYTNWASISRDGAAAARAGNMNAVKGSCRGCHDQYRTKYRTEMRARPLP